MIPAFSLYQPPTAIAVGVSSTETIRTATATIKARRTALRFPTPDTPLDVDVWIDERGRLLRVLCPSQTLDVVRADIVSAVSRSAGAPTSTDEEARIQSEGFTLAAAISKPAGSGRTLLPSVVLVGSPGLAERDEALFGIPLFRQLADALAASGFLVVRYDRRGTGASGGQRRVGDADRPRRRPPPHRPLRQRQTRRRSPDTSR